MTLRIGWLSPLTPASGVGTFSHAVTAQFPTNVGGEAIDLTLLYPDHAVLHHGDHRSVRIEDSDSFRNVLELFDLLVYNIGNNTEHHETIFRLLRTHPGVIVCHDYVYQHYLAARSMASGRSFASFAALLMKFGDEGAGSYLERSRITSRVGKIRYSPWDSDASAAQPMSEAILDLGSALVVHSRFAHKHAEKRFKGPILRLGMPHDQKTPPSGDTFEAWSQTVATKHKFHMIAFGHIQATKCLDLILEAMASSKMLRLKIRFTIVGFVGDFDYFRRLEELVATLGMRKIVHFETGVSDARLLEITSDADLFINLRRPNTEGSSASLIEQLDSGRPVVVLDSGCYAEIWSNAAVKLPVDAGAEEIKSALEQLLENPGNLPIIGNAGRAYARKWTCASYSQSIVDFILQHRDLLHRRGVLLGAGAKPRRANEDRDANWIANLAQARAAMRYLDRNILVLDPELIMRMNANDLCSYVAQVIFGIFNDPRLVRALGRFFVGREGRSVYWACAKFSLIVEAVFVNDEGARDRLAISGPCFDPEYWDVLESLPPPQYVSAATLTILGRSPTLHELALAGEVRSSDGSGKRRALIEIVQSASSNITTGAAKLKRWLEQPLEHDLGNELPAILRDLDCGVGSFEFREHVDLSGFFPQESDHAWSRGSRGFVALRLGPEVQRVEVAVRSVDADAEQPAVIRLSTGTTIAEIEVRTCEPHWIILDIPQHFARSDATTWLQLSTSRIGRPVGSPDTRVLGVCLLQLKIMTAPCNEVRTLMSPAEP